VEIRDLIYFVALASTGNFTRAAESLDLTTSTVSRRIGRLEDELGLALFERGHSGVHLTSGGRAVIPHVKRALDELEAVKRAGAQSGSGDLGQIRLGMQLPPAGGSLVSLLADWRALHPGVDLVVSEVNDRDLAAALGRGRLDVALALSDAVWPQAATAPLYRERLLAALPAEHALAKQEPIQCRDLHGQTVLIQGWEESPAARALYESFLGERPQFRCHAASRQSIFALVGAGFGIALATASEAKASFPGVVFRAIDDPKASIEIVLAWRQELEDAAVGRFVSFLRDEARSRRLF
jgi:DNA-binding transcriptional LysR family regulator